MAGSGSCSSLSASNATRKRSPRRACAYPVWSLLWLLAAVGASLEATQALAGQAQVAAPLKATRTISVGTSADFKSALLEAQPGDQILLAAGVPLVGNFTLPSQPAA